LKRKGGKMLRSVLKLGKNTLVVSLPKQWTSENKIKKGDQLIVNEKDAEIVFSLGKKKPVGSIEIDLKNRGRSACWKLAFAAYIKGYEEIILKNVNREQTHIVRDISNQLIGMVLTNEQGSSFILKELSESNEEEFPRIFPKIYLLMKDIIKQGIDAIKREDFKVLKELDQRDWTINKFVTFCLRTLNKSKKISSEKKIFYYNSLTDLEQLGDVFADFFVRIGEEQSRLSSEQKSFLRQLFTLIEHLSIIIYKPEPRKIIDVYEEKKTLEKKCKEFKDSSIKIQFLWILEAVGDLIEAILPGCM
jgi:phosphate uptake regulator